LSFKKRVTTQDIADKVGVSKATVSYVLNGTGSVSEEMKTKIRRCAEEIGYRANRIAKATRTGQTHAVGLVLPDLSNPFFPELAQAAHEAARKKGYSVFLVDAQNSIENEIAGVERLMEYAIDGLIWCPIDNEALYRNSYSLPIVVIDRPANNFDSVYANFEEGGRIQAELVNKNGHKKIGILSGPSHSPSAVTRRKSLYETLNEDVEVLWDHELSFTKDIPDNVKSDVLNSGVTCLVCANDFIAIGLIKFCHESNIDIPAQISIIGFDDIDWADLVTPSLTTITIPIREMGTRSFELLYKRMLHPQSPIEERILDVALVKRKSLKTFG